MYLALYTYENDQCRMKCDVIQNNCVSNCLQKQLQNKRHLQLNAKTVKKVIT